MEFIKEKITKLYLENKRIIPAEIIVINGENVLAGRE